MESCDKINKSHTDVTPPAVHVGIKQIGSFYPKNNKAAASGKSRLNMEATAGRRGTISLLHCSTSVDSSRFTNPSALQQRMQGRRWICFLGRIG